MMVGDTASVAGVETATMMVGDTTSVVGVETAKIMLVVERRGPDRYVRRMVYKCAKTPRHEDPLARLRPAACDSPAVSAIRESRTAQLLVPLPRSRLKRWKSLKEKRAAWARAN